jgi:hypothetical protein
VLAGLGAAAPPAPGSTVYVFGLPSDVAPGVTVFADTWAFSGAVRLTYGDPTLRGYPVLPGARLVCGPTAFLPQFLPGEGGNLADPRPSPDFEYGQQYDDKDHGARYGAVVFMDASTGRMQVIDDRDGCIEALRSLPVGR